MEIKRCYNCKFWALQDSGYSNWTVMETNVHCLKKKFESIEESYSWKSNANNPENDHEFYKQAESCDEYKKECGVQINLDVDGDTTIEDFKEDAEVYEAAVAYFEVV